MNLTQVLTRALGSSEFFLRKNAPTILTGAGVAGFIASIAITIHATPKAMDKLQAISVDVAEVKSRSVGLGYSEKEQGKDLTKVYIHSAIYLGRVYGPTLLLGSASIICVISAHGMMLKRQAGLVAAYTALSTAYEAYRRRVVEEIGEEKELELYRRVKTIPSVGEDGGPCEIVDFSDSMPSPYAFFYDDSSPNWRKTAEYNMFFLRSQQAYMNNRLKSRGFLFLNEVREGLGLPYTQHGQVVGWKVPDDNCRKCGPGETCPNCKGDGYVDFGLYDMYDEIKRAFVNGNESVVLIDPNVDGPIQI